MATMSAPISGISLVGRIAASTYLGGLAGAARLGASQVGDQHAEALGRDGCEQPGLVGEMVRGRRVRDPGTAGDLAQAEPVGAHLVQGCHRGVQESLPQISGEVFAHGARGAWPQARTSCLALD